MRTCLMSFFNLSTELSLESKIWSFHFGIHCSGAIICLNIRDATLKINTVYVIKHCWSLINKLIDKLNKQGLNIHLEKCYLVSTWTSLQPCNGFFNSLHGINLTSRYWASGWFWGTGHPAALHNSTEAVCFSFEYAYADFHVQENSRKITICGVTE